MPPKSSKSKSGGKPNGKPSAPKKADKKASKKTTDKKVEKLSDITDEIDDTEEKQPSKSKRKQSDADADADNDNDAEVEDNAEVSDDGETVEDEEEMPALEAVSTALKEKYEYKPLQRVKTVYVRPKDRITSEVMTKFEYAEAISIRAKQLEDGDQPFTDVGDLQDPIDMAKKEISDKKCPLSIVRNRTFEGDTTIAELWQINEMAIPYD